jgi:Domain of unknown function (DUF1772)
MMLLTLAIVATGLFAGAAIYVSLVEHPARLSCGTALAIREFGPSYRRGAVQQASLAIIGCATGGVAGWQRSDVVIVAAAVLLGLLVPFTLMAIAPTNHRLLDPALDENGPEAAVLLSRWGRLHAVRSVLGVAAFLLLVIRTVQHARW